MNIHPALYIGQTKNKGRGVFTHERIAVDEMVELSPVIVMDDADRKKLDETLLHDYIFEWTPGDSKQCCMAQGYISVYNHSYTSNCEYFMMYEDNTIMIRTVREIAAGEELTINYNGDWNDERPVWFDVHD